MDIRSAKRPKGTTTSTIATERHERGSDTPAFNDDGTLQAAPEGIHENIVMRQYWEYLKQNKITRNDLTSILDSLLTTGNVMWDFKLFDKMPVKFQVRPAWVDDLIIERVDDATAGKEKVSAMRYNNMVAEMNLAASLRQFGDVKFEVKSEDDLEKSIEFVKGMSYIFRNKLVDRLAVFDRAVAVATSDWALKNFTNPPTAD